MKYITLISGIWIIFISQILLANTTQAQLSNSPWPMMGHDTRHTGQSQYHGPQAPYLKWNTEISRFHGEISSPAISIDGIIYVGGNDMKLCAINSDGTLKWEYDTEGTVRSSPAIGSDGTIYVGSTSGSLYALNPDGALKWKFHKESFITSSPAINSDGTIFVGSGDNYLYAINQDGTLKWKFQTGNIVTSSPAVGKDGVIYVGSEDTLLYAVKPDGIMKWKFKTGQYVGTPAISADGTIYVGYKIEWSGESYLVAINQDGTLKWKFQSLGFTRLNSVSISSDGTVYFGSSKLYALNPDGTLKWKYSVGGFVSSTPAIGMDGLVYIGSSNGSLYTLNPDGKLKRKFLISSNYFDIYSPVIDSDGTVYVGSDDGYLSALGNATGPIVSVSSENLDFGSLHVGDSKALILKISNIGVAPLSITNLTVSSTEFSVTPTNFTVAENSTQSVTVTFKPSYISVKSETLTITSNDPRPSIIVPLNGIGEGLSLYIQPDSTLSQIPYDIPNVSSWQITQYIYSFTNPPEWKYPLPGDISGNSYLVSLMAGYLGVTNTKLKAEIILLSNKAESLLASTEFIGASIIPPYMNDLSRQIISIQGIDPSSAVGDTLIMRISFVSGNIGIIAYGEPLGQSYISIPDPSGLPETPILVSPLNGSTDVTTNPTLNWNASTDASSYHLQVSGSTTFNPMVFEDSTISLTTQQIGPLTNNTMYFWRLIAKNSNGNSYWSPVWSFTTNAIISIIQNSAEIPTEFSLGNNYPNPFYLSTSIGYSIPSSGKVTLMVFDTWCNEIATLVNEEQIAGKYEVIFDGSKFLSGIYFYRLQAGEYSKTKKMILIK